MSAASHHDLSSSVNHIWDFEHGNSQERIYVCFNITILLRVVYHPRTLALHLASQKTRLQLALQQFNEEISFVTSTPTHQSKLMQMSKVNAQNTTCLETCQPKVNRIQHVCLGLCI